MKAPKIDTSGTAAAQAATARAQEAANNLSKNFRADLGTENLSNVIAGGSADAAAGGMLDAVRKRKPQAGLSSSLGIG